MMKCIVKYLLVVILMITVSCNQGGSFTRTDSGIEIKTEKGELVRLEIITPTIIHVRATIAGQFSVNESLVAIRKADKEINYEVEEGEGYISLLTEKLIARTNLETGEVSFFDRDGNLIINEAEGGRTFNSIEVDGVKGYELRQVWKSADDTEGIYGLGQHQAHEMNYKGANEELFQYNTKVSVPLIVSTANYGILWDNYSLSRYGDPRPYGQIDQLVLFDAEGKEGALTATYMNNTDGSDIFTVRREAKIDYENLETVNNFPEGFNFNDSRITWEGEFQPREDGIYDFLLYYAGYTKLWIDGELVADRWRTAWNPSVAKIKKELKAGNRYSIKLDWLPDGGVSYIGLKVHTPVDLEERKNISFYSEMGDEINYYFIKGESMDEVIAGYRYITGKAQVMPKWAMGFWQSRERYKTQDELLGALKDLRKNQIPVDVIVMDWFYWEEDSWGSQKFDLERFPDPKAMVDEVHENNAKIMISVWPKYYHTTDNFKQFDEKGWMYRLAVEDSIRDWVGKGYIGSFYDAYNPGARKLFWDQIRENLYSLGVDAWWLDATEPDILSNASVEYRKLLMNPTYLGPSTKYFNAYALMNAKGIYEGQREFDNSKRVFILTRSGFAGMQRYGTVTWSGDIGTVWEDMKAQISAGVNFSMSGLPYWTMDNGGFCVEKRYERAVEGSEDMNEWRELNARWHQFGTFVPLFRTHGQYPFREMYNISPVGHPVYNTMLEYNKLRYRLLPYIYSLAGAVYHKDYTIMRGMAMDYPHDKNVYDINDQYMFGPAFLVCPVYEYKARSRELYLPEGNDWYNFHTGALINGGNKLNADAPLDRIPLFVPEGAIIPFGPELQYAEQASDETVTIVVYTGKDGVFTLYEDEGNNYNYENGAYSTIELNYSEADQKLIIGKREGSFPGMKENRQFRVIFASKERGFAYAPSNLTKGQVFNYNGEELVVSKY